MSVVGHKGAKNLDDHQIDRNFVPQKAKSPEWQEDWLVYRCCPNSSKGDKYIMDDDPKLTLDRDEGHLTGLITYESLSPHQRWYFRDWLNIGRDRVPESSCYLLLWLCSVERRIFEEGNDLQILVDEVMRLHLMCLDSPRSDLIEYFKCSAELLWYLSARYGSCFSSEVVFLCCHHLAGEIVEAQHQEFLRTCFNRKTFERELLFPILPSNLSYKPLNQSITSQPRNADAPTLELQRELLLTYWAKANARWQEKQEKHKFSPPSPINVQTREVSSSPAINEQKGRSKKRRKKPECKPQP